ncbi:MAG: tetratricopeptide repeat protein [Vicinamibacteria bacterium]|nr:tetratricopeptide repeat protein [Vicinamibacteria bacterium]
MSADVRVCAACGAMNRSDWRTCQRCRRQLQTAPVAPPARGRRASTTWLIVAGTTAVAALAMGLPSSREAASVDPSLSRPPAASDDAVLERPTVSTQPVEVVLTPVTKEDFARAGESAYAQGQMGVALSAFESAVAAFPADPEARNNLGQMLVRAGRVTEALGHLQAAAAADPDKWTFRFNLARARGLSGDWEGAVADYRTAAQTFPDDHVTLYNLACAQQKLGQHADAVASLERAVSLHPSQSSYLLTLAVSYEKLSRLPEAVQAYRAFLDSEPQAKEASAIRARIGRLEQVGVPEGAAQTTSAHD